MRKTLYFVALICLLVSIECKKEDDDKNCSGAPIINAGNDTTVYNGTALQLNGITNSDNGIWSVAEGQGGTIDSTSGSVVFKGSDDTEYTLNFVSSNDCGTSTDSKIIIFIKDCSVTPTGSAGDDINLFNVTKTNLNATATNGTGEWKIVNGSGGTIADINNPKSEFTGRFGIPYELQWAVKGLCTAIVDTVVVKFNKVTANAGNDITIYNNTSVKLRGSLTNGTGEWSVLSGGGSFTNNKLGNTEFTGTLNSTNQLVWTVTQNSIVEKDTITVKFIEKECGSDMTVDQMVQNIHWITQSCFRIEGSSFKIYIDPQEITQKDEADIILITHNHGDHFLTTQIDKLVGPKTVIIAPSTCTYSGILAKRISLDLNSSIVENGCITIQAVPAYNIVGSNHAHNNSSVGYIITINGVKIYHSGDTERIPEMKDFNCDIAMIPLGQTYTFTSIDEAVEAAKDINPTVVIPMHYGGPEGKDADAETFKSKLDGVLDVVIKTRGQ